MNGGASAMIELAGMAFFAKISKEREMKNMRGEFTGGILFWGIPYENREFPKLQMSWFDEYARSLGEGPGWDEKKCEEHSGCLVGSYMFGSEGHRFAAIADSLAQAKVGEIEEVAHLEIKPDWEERLRSFCKAINLPWKQPAWTIACCDSGH